MLTIAFFGSKARLETTQVFIKKWKRCINSGTILNTNGLQAKYNNMDELYNVEWKKQHNTCYVILFINVKKHAD